MNVPTSEALQRLSEELNNKSAEFGKVIAQLDEHFKKLGLGLEVWVDLESQVEFFGYAKVNNKWGLALSREGTIWLFNDGPRELRLRAIDRLQQLVEMMIERAIETTKVMREKITFVEEIVKRVEHGS